MRADVLSVSEPRADRGASRLLRVYRGTALPDRRAARHRHSRASPAPDGAGHFRRAYPVTAAKTHILRVKPPWRLSEPDAEMAAQARPYWQWSAIIRGGNNLAPECRRDVPGDAGHVLRALLDQPRALRLPGLAR